MSDTANWMPIEGMFIAQGGEQYLTIGNFFYDNATQYLLVNDSAPTIYYAYYYIDDVSVTKCSQITAVSALMGTQPIQIYPNPASTETTVTLPSNKTAALQIADAVGCVLYSVETDSHQAAIDISRFPNGLYFLKLTDAATRLTSQTKFVVQR